MTDLKAENARLAGEVERLREELRYFALDDTAFHDADEPGEPHAVIGVSITRKHAAKLRDLCGAYDEQSLSGPCGRLLVGQGDDTYDPTCVLSAGHDGRCKPEENER